MRLSATCFNIHLPSLKTNSALTLAMFSVVDSPQSTSAVLGLIRLVPQPESVLSILRGTFMKLQHPIVGRFVANWERRRVGVYAGKNFAVATVRRSKRVEIRVEPNVNPKERR